MGDVDKEKGDWFCGANTEKKRFGERLSTWNDQGKESNRKVEVKVHRWNKRQDWMRDRGGRAKPG